MVEILWLRKDFGQGRSHLRIIPSTCNCDEDDVLSAMLENVTCIKISKVSISRSKWLYVFYLSLQPALSKNVNTWMYLIFLIPLYIFFSQYFFSLLASFLLYHNEVTLKTKRCAEKIVQYTAPSDPHPAHGHCCSWTLCANS